MCASGRFGAAEAAAAGLDPVPPSTRVVGRRRHRRVPGESKFALDRE